MFRVLIASVVRPRPKSSGITMAKRELSSTLKNLKFMQRAVQREEKSKKEEEEKFAPNENGDLSFSTTPAVTRKCVVIMEGNPHPGAIKGRMSFQSFNPSIDKLHEAEENPYQPKATSANSGDGKNQRENGSSSTQPEESNELKPDHDYDGDYKRKHPESATEAQYPNKSPKSASGDGPNNRNGSHRQKKREKLDWNLLRPPPKVQDRME